MPQVAPCDFGDTAFNTDDDPFTCNNKLIGAYDFTDTYKAVIGLIPTEFDSARDSNGHGSHTLTTAAGNGGVSATLLGFDRGFVSGIAPRAHVIAYKGCGLAGCCSSDTSAAVAQAILDGVDVMNYSISGGGNPYGDVVSLAFLDAYDAGLLVNASAGNSGPGADTVAHREPWTLTVGASTSDRHFISTASFTADGGDTMDLSGASVTDGLFSATDVVFPPLGEELCLTPLPPGTFSGEIVICERGLIARVTKSFNVAEGGAGGMLLYNPVLQGLATDNHFIPSIHLEFGEGVDLLAFMGSHTGVEATLTAGLATAVPGDEMAAFSSRGGPGQTLGISKPDVTAPGVQILAGMTPLPEDPAGGLPGELFQSIQGTSMSAPHTTGSAALVKAANPGWTPGEIKSALITTALRKVKKEDGITNGDAFDFGSGRINPPKANNASLTISDTGANFLALEDELWNANTASVFYPAHPGETTTDRTVMDQTGGFAVWSLKAQAQKDVKITVPKAISVPGGGSATFSIEVDASDVPIGETRFGTILLSSTRSKERHRIPVTLVRAQAGVSIEGQVVPIEVGKKTCSPATAARNNSCSIRPLLSAVQLLPTTMWPSPERWLRRRHPSWTLLSTTSRHRLGTSRSRSSGARPTSALRMSR